MNEYLRKTLLPCLCSLLWLVEAYDIIRQVTTLEEKAFDALEWLAAMCPLIPNKGEQDVFSSEQNQNFCGLLLTAYGS